MTNALTHIAFNSIVFSFSADIVLEAFSLISVIIEDIKHPSGDGQANAVQLLPVEKMPGMTSFRMIRTNHAVAKGKNYG